MAKRKNNRKYQMTYIRRERQQPQWRKRYKSKDYTFTRRKGESKEASYKRCYGEWKRLKLEIDRESDPELIAQAAIEHWTARAEIAQEGMARIEALENPKETDKAEYERLLMVKLWSEKHVRTGFPIKPTIGQMAAQFRHDTPTFWPWNAKELAGTGALNEEETLKANVDVFIEWKLTQHQQGKLSAKRFGALKDALETVCKILGPTSAVQSLDGIWLERVRNTLNQRIAEGEISSYAGRDVLQAFKQFVRWLWERGTIEVPRNLESRDMNIAATAPAPEIFTDQELKTLFSGDLSRSLRLYLLLMLNCGFQQQDIADLRKDEFNPASGTITRQRSKTSKRHDGKVPRVTWKLWPATLELLRQLKDGETSEPLLLTNANGKPLKTVTVTNGEVKTIDNIRSAWGRYISKLKRNGTPISKSMKLLRKTAASRLGQHTQYSRYGQYFLAHAANSTAERHYVMPSQEEFDCAIEWLGTQFFPKTD